MMPAAAVRTVLALSASPLLSLLLKATVVAALALMFGRLTRRLRASARHAVLCAAFAVLLMLPLASWIAPPVRILMGSGGLPAAVAPLSAPIVEPASFVPVLAPGSKVPPYAPSRSPLSATQFLFGAWLLGAGLCLLPVVCGLWQTRLLRRSALPWRKGQLVVEELRLCANGKRHIDLLLHERAPGPLTSGALRPGILLPVAAQTWPEKELAAALIHEIEHVRRCDWISRVLARLTCSLYWFHPLVWMMWRQFVLDAERACDDAALAGTEATAYADQLVALAQSLVDSRRRTLLAMAGRDDLARRVSAVLDRRQRRGSAGKVCIGLSLAAALLFAAVLSPLRIVARAQAASAAQSPLDTAQRFEVASIRPCKEEDFAIPGQRRPELTISPGRVTVNCLPLQRIVYFAYAGVGSLDHPLLNDRPSNPDHVRSGPGWLASESFVIEATAKGIPARTVMMGPMLRSLLEERFHLKTHRETEEIPMYGLMVAKSGLKIQPLGEEGCTSGDAAAKLSDVERLQLNNGPRPVCGNFQSTGDGVNARWALGGTTLTKFANQILSNVLDRFVMDQTGVSGLFNIHLTFGLDESIAAGVFGGRPTAAYSAENPPPAGIEKEPSIFSALEEQLGLRLEKTRGPHEYLVIDSVERPSGMQR